GFGDVLVRNFRDVLMAADARHILAMDAGVELFLVHVQGAHLPVGARHRKALLAMAAQAHVIAERIVGCCAAASRMLDPVTKKALATTQAAIVAMRMTPPDSHTLGFRARRCLRRSS